MEHTETNRINQGSGRPLIGIRIPTWATFAYGIYPGILRYMREHQRWRLATVVDSTQEIEPTVIDQNWVGDGLILFRYTQEEADTFRERGIPVVNISSEPPRDNLSKNRDLLVASEPAVVVDNAACGKMAAEHFLRRGFEFFVFWDDPARLYAKHRGEAFEKALADVGHQCLWIDESAARIPLQNRWQMLQVFIQKKLRELVEQAKGKPVAIFTKDDIWPQASIIHACDKLGLSVPKQVAILGCGNDQSFVHTTDPAMSSISYPAHEIGYQAAAMLHRMMQEKIEEKRLGLIATSQQDGMGQGILRAKKSSPKTDPSLNPARIIVQPGKLSARESTGIMAYDDQVVGAALAFIWQESPKRSLSVSQVADEVAVSGVVLRRRFSDVLSYSPKHEIDRVRLRHLLGYLDRTDWSMKKISLKMGFTSSEEMARFLRRHKSVSPSDYRESLKT